MHANILILKIYVCFVNNICYMLTIYVDCLYVIIPQDLFIYAENGKIFKWLYVHKFYLIYIYL